MSTLKVNKLRDTAGSADAITLDPNGGAVLAGVTTVTSVKVGAAVTISESGIEASGIGITCANINGTQIGGRRNLVINGAMQVAQRGTSSTTNDGYFTVDRIYFYNGAVDENCTTSQSSVSSGTTPYSLGFRKAFKVQNGNQTSGAGAGDEVLVRYRFEAQDIDSSGWNYTSSSSFITLSYWVKSSVAQNFYVNLKTSDGTAQNYVTETGSLTADTWTKVTKTIPGNSNLTFDDNNGEGLFIQFNIFKGTNDTGTRPLNAWAAYSSSSRVPDMTSDWYETDNATFEITGLQLEVGSQATAFERRSYGEELALCQRYFFAHSGEGVNGSNPNPAPDTNLCTCSVQSTASVSYNVPLPVPMRVIPTLYSTVTGSTRYRLNSAGANQNSGSDPTINTVLTTHTMASGSIDGFSNLSAGQAGNVRRYLGTGILGFSAEL